MSHERFREISYRSRTIIRVKKEKKKKRNDNFFQIQLKKKNFRRLFREEKFEGKYLILRFARVKA